jgi:predicted NBD/HSP70 family sugar kinase
LEAARAGDKLSSALIEELGDYLGLGIANLVNLFNPSVVVLSSSMEKAGPELLERIKRVVKIQSVPQAVAPLVFRYGKLGSEAGVLGGALVVLDELFKVPEMRTPKFLLQTAGASRFQDWKPPSEQA